MICDPNPVDTDTHEGYHQFKSEEGEKYGSFEVWWKEHTDDTGEYGWYWWACFPGYMPDGEPIGPFDTSIEAYEDAMEV